MKEKNGLLQKIVGAVGIALCVVFVPLLLINVTLIVKSYTSPDKVPDFFGYKPFIVLSGSMEPSIMTGDMVFVKETDPDSLKVGDVIAYKSGSAVVTHRIVEVKSENGETRYVTQVRSTVRVSMLNCSATARPSLISSPKLRLDAHGIMMPTVFSINDSPSRIRKPSFSFQLP